MTNIFTSFKGLSGRIWLLAFVNFINRSGSMIMCFLSLYIIESLHYSLSQAGIAMACFGIGAIIGQQIGGSLTDKIGYRRVQLVSLVATGAMALVLLQVRDYYVLCATLFTLSCVSEAFRPANSVAISFNSTAATRTRSFSLLRVAFNLAITLSLTLGGWLILQSWHYIFWVDALTCFAAAAALFFLLPEAPAQEFSETLAASQQQHTADDAWIAFKDPLYVRFIIGTFLGALSFMQLVWSVPPFFKQYYHWNEFTIGCVSAINGVVVMLLEMPVVHYLERHYKMMSLIRMGTLLYAASYVALMLPLAQAWTAAVLYMTIISFGEIWVMPFSTTWALKCAPEGQEGKYMSLYGMAYATSNVVAPLIGTQLMSHFPYQVLWGAASLIAVGAWLIFKSLPEKL